ncbi:hypothetical protein KBY66_14735 [Synechococcus sp. Tobar12-5m-g]|uniref:hypothetical protein n=1 Tax=unclassified Synechococcus TaxID=2626047 RepID=UPI0020CE6027|nr:MULTISPECIES: hypothetical protein [unclassified Synechococcus]MCP9773849.1 hypothetical protein [Synechococcus sp. Tobar12-5m-g]MCP9874980.1 hypothetical protein [Synechococcus sp. Cruz CV-v-12]
MQSSGSDLQVYNYQLAVDSDHQVIVVVGLSNKPPDTEHLAPVTERIAANTGALPKVMSMDTGHWSEDNAIYCADLGIDAYIATGRLQQGQPPPPKRGPMPKDDDAKARMGRKLPRVQERCHPSHPYTRGLEDMTNAPIQRGHQG